MSEFDAVVGAKVVRVTERELFFDNGYVIEFHPFETYVERYEGEAIPSEK